MLQVGSQSHRILSFLERQNTKEAHFAEITKVYGFAFTRGGPMERLLRARLVRKVREGVYAITVAGTRELQSLERAA